MKTILLIMAGVSALSAAVPAAAQYGRYDGGSADARTDQLRQRIDDDMRRGLLNRSDGYQLSRQASDLRRLQDQYRANGYSSSERADLDRRFDALANQVAYAERGRAGTDRYGSYDRNYGGTYDPYSGARQGGTYGGYGYGGYGSGNSYDPYAGTDGYSYGGSIYDRNNDGYDDRDYNGDGRFDPDTSGYSGYDNGYSTYDGGAYDNDTYGNDNGADAYDNNNYDDRSDGNGAYTAPDQGSYDNGSTGYDDGPGTSAGGDLNVGDHAPSNLSPVPPEFRNLYADGNGVYYRYDDGRVFQIDTATNTIRWVGEISN